MNTAFTPLLLALTLALFSGGASAKNTSSAELIISVPPSPNAPVSRVTVVASATDFPALSLNLTATGDTWSGTLANIPSGAQRSFRVQAFDAANTLLAEDSVSGITLTANKPKRITLQLEPVTPPPTVESSRGNHLPPRLTQSSQSSKTVAPGGTVTFKVAARDPENTALTFTWSASSGTPGTSESEANRSRASWIAPACAVPGTPTTVTATVSNAFGLTASKVFTLKGLPACVSKWVATGSMAAARGSLAAVALSDGKVLVTGGRDDSQGGRLSSAELYDPATGTWSTTGPMAEARDYHRLLLLPGGKVLVAGGTGKKSDSLSTAELYDPVKGTWSATGSMPWVSTDHTPVLLPNGKVLTATGKSSTGIPGAEVYDPATGTWSVTGPMGAERHSSTVTLLPNGKVLVTGGFGSYGAGQPASAELYDPATGAWSAAGSMDSPRQHHTATLLPNGTVLIVGGANGPGALTSTELYDPATGTWSTTASLVTARLAHTATLLPNGQVLVAGGYNDGKAIASAELYMP